MNAVSKIDQCLWRIQYFRSPDAVLLLIWFSGLETRAAYAISSSAVLTPSTTGLVTEMSFADILLCSDV
ncbi:hypothetical protein PBCV1_a673L [Paramecium bursaria Chlorella virus 1]|uniref:Uncharacterized protein n=1 Tax=Paramecium bursaria Chlorella virus 1 TaxID=10506 RepID=O41155_PBCV1|nr:hypothetical protein PBCV1_a673L [Paramecium bursaria Chlorella virus 1]AAC97049.1 hypothetical protein [Paramecium bursaria Chlorella virus 1]